MDYWGKFGSRKVDDTERALRTQVAANCCTQHQGSVALCGRVQCILPMVGSLFRGLKRPRKSCPDTKRALETRSNRLPESSPPGW
jgi:hypothetical protein